jgi:L-glyceraldehyde 3-phosphate reductase
MSFHPARYDAMNYRRCGSSGLKLPEISLGLWQGTGSYVEDEVSRKIVHTAFDNGITHFDLANNYGSPAGTSEELFGRILKGMPRDEIIVSSKAGYRMPTWPGPYGDGGSRKSLIASCDQSLKRLGLDYVDIFYSHRLDRETPLEETMGALETLVRQGKALYAGVSNYPDPWFSDSIRIMRERGWAPITIHQPCYSMLRRAPESEVLPTAGREGVGVIGFSPLAQGLLTGKYLRGIPSDSRVSSNKGNGAIDAARVTPEILEAVAQLAVIAEQRGQSLAQMALAWLLKDPRVTSVLIGASKAEQITDCVGALKNPHFTAGELDAIEKVLPKG